MNAQTRAGMSPRRSRRGGIVSGMSPKGGFDAESAEQIIEATRKFRETPPGSVRVHHDVTGFFRKVFDTETGVLDALKDAMRQMPAYDPSFFRVAPPAEPAYPVTELASIVPMNQKAVYSIENVIARVVDAGEHLEFRPDFRPEVYTLGHRD